MAQRAVRNDAISVMRDHILLIDEVNCDGIAADIDDDSRRAVRPHTVQVKPENTLRPLPVRGVVRSEYIGSHADGGTGVLTVTARRPCGRGASASASTTCAMEAPATTGDERRCERCDYAGPHERAPGTPPHAGRLNCGQCGEFVMWLRKPENEKKRRSNRKHRAYWLALMGGVLYCAMCGIREDGGYRVAFEIDHMWAVEDGGPEQDARYTMPLCRTCHVIKNALRAARLHALGRSARDGGQQGEAA